MLKTPQRGVTLIELMISVMIIGILAIIGAPSFRHWIMNSQIRASSEAIFSGLQLARAEAVRRNAQVRFQLTNTMTNACVLSTSGTNWIISQDTPAGSCASTPSDTVAPRIIQSRTSTETNVVVAADQSAITFNGLGRVVSPPASDININVTNPTGGVCIAASGPMRCLRVVVSIGGQVRMCDPSLATSNPMGC